MSISNPPETRSAPVLRLTLEDGSALVLLDAHLIELRELHKAPLTPVTQVLYTSTMMTSYALTAKVQGSPDTILALYSTWQKERAQFVFESREQFEDMVGIPRGLH